MNASTTAVNTYTNLFDPNFTFSRTTLLRIWSKGGNFLFTKGKQTLTWEKGVRKRITHSERGKIVKAETLSGKI